MPVERIDMHRLQDLVRLHRLGVGARTIARRLRMSPNTERQYRLALAAGLVGAEYIAHDLGQAPLGGPVPELRP
jgi:hypothetical protein